MYVGRGSLYMAVFVRSTKQMGPAKTRNRLTALKEGGFQRMRMFQPWMGDHLGRVLYVAKTRSVAANICSRIDATSQLNELMACGGIKLSCQTLQF